MAESSVGFDLKSRFISHFCGPSKKFLPLICDKNWKQQCPFGKNRGAGLVHQLSSANLLQMGQFPATHYYQPTNGNLGHLADYVPNQSTNQWESEFGIY